MRQVFYIDADEEMISVIGRLRKSSASENIIVAPHRSLILQSIVNLRLLNHDARKNGKEIIVVTQDDQSRSLCEKAGIATQAVLDDGYEHEQQTQYGGTQPPMQSQHSPYPEQHFPPPINGEGLASDKSANIHFPYADAVGSADFFTPHAGAASQTQSLSSRPPVESFGPQAYGNAKQVSVRDQNPKKLTILNSHRFEEERRLNQQKSFTPPSLRGAQPSKPVFVPQYQAPVSQASSMQPSPAMQSMPSRYTHHDMHQAPAPAMSQSAPPQNYQQNQHPPSFLEHRKAAAQTPIAPPAKPSEKQVVVKDGGKMRAFFIFFGFVSVLSVGLVFAYLFLPKAEVRVKLKTMTQKSDFEFDGSTHVSAYATESKSLPVKIVEMDQEVKRSFDTTSKASLGDQKARGTVKISNEFSSDPQTLVASTRLLSKEGKTFRLLSGVSVPGMVTANGKTEPGVIEAIIVADQAGSEYNIASTTFTIPGFEGSAKYAKFSASSVSAIVGGGVNGSDALAVSDQDIARAKKSVEAEVKKLAEDIMTQSLASGEKVLSEAIETSVVASSSSPQTGAVTKTFDYKVKFHIKAFVFSETDLKKMAIELFAKQNAAKGSLITPSSVDIQYGEPTEDFVSGTLRISAHAVARFDSTLDEDQLKSDLLGQNESDLAMLLQKYTQIDTISVELSPEFLSSKIPTRTNQVTLIIESGDAPDAKRQK